MVTFSLLLVAGREKAVTLGAALSIMVVALALPEILPSASWAKA